jgi:antitoxin HicB
MSDTPYYSILIQWSDEDQSYVVILPEWKDLCAMPVTDAATWEEAARKGSEVFDTLIRITQKDGKPLPAPRTFAFER